MFTTTQEVSTESSERRLLQASRRVMAYPAMLAGYRTVHQALEDNYLNSYIRTFWASGGKSLGVPDFEANPQEYINTLLYHLPDAEEFQSLSDLCRDGSSVLAEWVLPPLLDRLVRGKEVSSLAFLLAVYGHYLQAGTDDKGQAYPVDEPQFTPHDWALLANSDVLAVLDLSVLAPARLRSFPQLLAQYKTYRNQLACYGLAFSLRQTLCTFWEEEKDELGDLSKPAGMYA